MHVLYTGVDAAVALAPALQAIGDVPWPFFVGVAAVIGIAVVSGVLAHRAEKRRIAELEAWSAARGFDYDPQRRGAPNLPFELFDRGHSRWSSHLVTGRLRDALRGLPDPGLELFHYHYAVTTGSGKDRRTRHYHQRCAVLDLGIDLGAIDIRPENLFDKFAAAVGFDDIDVEDPEFSKRFHVKARDRRDVYALLGSSMTDHLSTAAHALAIRGSLVLVSESGRAEVADYARLEAFVAGFAAAVPRVVVNNERERRGLAPLLDAGDAARRPEASDPERGEGTAHAPDPRADAPRGTS